MQLDDVNAEVWGLYIIVRDQLRITPMGDVIGLDHGAVLDVLKLYTDDVKAVFEWILLCYRIEKEVSK